MSIPIREKAERSGWIQQEDKLQDELAQVRAENARLLLVVDYARRACNWSTVSEAAIVMSIHRVIKEYDAVTQRLKEQEQQRVPLQKEDSHDPGPVDPS